MKYFGFIEEFLGNSVYMSQNEGLNLYDWKKGILKILEFGGSSFKLLVVRTVEDCTGERLKMESLMRRF